MKSLFRLLSSPVALSKGITSFITILYAANAGIWYPANLLAHLSLAYSGALAISIIARLGGDAVFARALRTAGGSNEALNEYVRTSIVRSLLAAVPVLYVEYVVFKISALGIIGIFLLAIAILLGNALRIASSPNYQIGFDNSSFGAAVLSAAIFISIPIDLAVALYSFSLLAIYGIGYFRQAGGRFTGASLLGYSSKYYFTAELGYFALGYASPALLVLAAGSEMAGMIRSVEQVVFAGTFVLFLTSNRLFYDLSRDNDEGLSFVLYLTRYSLPGFLFFLAVFAAIVVLAQFGAVPNIAAMPLVFLLYSLAHFVVVTCGPVGGLLNFAGDERYVTLSIMAGIVPLAILATLAIRFEDGVLLVLGSVIGMLVANLAQMYRLYGKLSSRVI